MAQNSEEAYRNGYLDGLLMAEKMRWQGTPIGDFWKGSPYQPDPDYRLEYEDGFRRAMEDSSRVEWRSPKY
jgi:hypothetical protein